MILVGYFFYFFRGFFSNFLIVPKLLNKKKYCFYSFPQTSGVPQVFHLAPNLFLTYINDILLSYLHTLLFADDLNNFRIIKSFDDANLLPVAVIIDF